jgi:hypothetical protein
MATIPLYRIPDDTKTRPSAFEIIILDACGPWKTSQGKGKATIKRWMLIIRDMMYGIIHIEILYKIDSSLFLSAFERFCSNRRVPTHVRLDNGTNFVAGKKDLSGLCKYVSESYVKANKPDIKWDFTPPYSPSQNGLIERMVGLAIAALKTVLDVTNEIITDETLQTGFKKVQGLSNDRPLAYWPQDCNDLEFLTLNHFLLSGKIGQDLAPIINSEKKGLETQYKIVLSLVDKFLRLFVQEMKPKMALYNKWIYQQPNLMKDNIVVILDKRESKVVPASRYPLARVLDTIKGHNGLVRKVSLLKFPARTGGAPIIRGINSVYVILPASDLPEEKEKETEDEVVHDFRDGEAIEEFPDVEETKLVPLPELDLEKDKKDLSYKPDKKEKVSNLPKRITRSETRKAKASSKVLFCIKK